MFCLILPMSREGTLTIRSVQGRALYVTLAARTVGVDLGPLVVQGGALNGLEYDP